MAYGIMHQQWRFPAVPGDIVEKKIAKTPLKHIRKQKEPQPQAISKSEPGICTLTNSTDGTALSDQEQIVATTLEFSLKNCRQLAYAHWILALTDC